MKTADMMAVMLAVMMVVMMVEMMVLKTADMLAEKMVGTKAALLADLLDFEYYTVECWSHL